MRVEMLIQAKSGAVKTNKQTDVSWRIPLTHLGLEGLVCDSLETRIEIHWRLLLIC